MSNAMGGLVAGAMGPLIEGVPLAGIVLLAVGGVLYTIGVPFYAWENLPFRRAIWHGFVMAAAAVHYAAVLTAWCLLSSARRRVRTWAWRRARPFHARKRRSELQLPKRTFAQATGEAALMPQVKLIEKFFRFVKTPAAQTAMQRRLST